MSRQDVVTKDEVQARQDAVNERLRVAGSEVRFEVGYRYGYAAIDRFRASDGAMIDTLRSALTKREAADILWAMGAAIDAV